MHNGDELEHGIAEFRRPEGAPPPYEAVEEQGQRNQRGQIRRGGRQGYRARGTVGGRNRRGPQADNAFEDVRPIRGPIGEGLDGAARDVHQEIRRVWPRNDNDEVPLPEAGAGEDDEGRAHARNRAEVWYDLEDRVFGHLRRFTGGIQRFPETIASLEQKGHAYVGENHEHLTNDHPIYIADVVSRAAIRALAAGAQGRALLDMYGNETIMQEIDELNRGIASMTDPRKRVGWGWYALAGAAAAAGIGALVKGRTVVGTATLATAATAAASLLWKSKAPGINNAWKNAWRLP